MSLLEPDLICKRLSYVTNTHTHTHIKRQCIVCCLICIFSRFTPCTCCLLLLFIAWNYAVDCKQIRFMMTNRIFIQCSTIDSLRMNQTCEYIYIASMRATSHGWWMKTNRGMDIFLLFFSRLSLPECLSALSACGTAKWGAGKSKNTASAFPFNSSLNPFVHTSRW